MFPVVKATIVLIRTRLLVRRAPIPLRHIGWSGNSQPPTQKMMKTMSITLLAGLALVATSQAGSPITEAAAVSAGPLWEWFVGGSAGYLVDLDEPMYTLHLGMERNRPGGTEAHSVFLEVGLTTDDTSYQSGPGTLPGARTEFADIDLNIIPVTLNYMFKMPITDRLNYYIGIGAGIAVLDSDYNWSWFQPVTPPFGQGQGGDNQTDVRFYGHVFTGLSYDFNESFGIHTGVRYIFMDEVRRDIDVTGVPDQKMGINGDVLFEIGASFHF